MKKFPGMIPGIAFFRSGWYFPVERRTEKRFGRRGNGGKKDPGRKGKDFMGHFFHCRVVCRPEPCVLPPWPLPFFPRSAGTTESGFESEEHPGAPFVQLNWCVSGRGSVRCGEEKFLAGEGDFFYSLPGELRRNESCSEFWKVRWIVFDGPGAEEFLRAYAFPRLIRGAGSCPDRLFDEFELGLRENTLPSMRRLIAVLSEILALAGGWGRREEGRTAQDLSADARLVRRFLNFVREHHARGDLDVNAIAETLGVHRSTLSRAVAEKLSIPPGKYLTQLRVQHALSLLRGTDLSVREAAWESGFSDIRSFSRLIRRATGMSPGEFRRGRGGGV